MALLPVLLWNQFLIGAAYTSQIIYANHRGKKLESPVKVSRWFPGFTAFSIVFGRHLSFKIWSPNTNRGGPTTAAISSKKPVTNLHEQTWLHAPY